MSQKDKMTPMERKKAIDEGRAYDRIPCVPFMSELKCTLSGVSIWDYWHDGAKMAQAESMLYHRYGYDRIVIGPNTRGIAEAFGAEFVYPKKSTPYIKESFLKDYEMLEQMNVICAAGNPRMETFREAARLLSGELGTVVPIEMSIGGPFTIASMLRGSEHMLRDCRKKPEELHRLLCLITDSQKSCIDMAAEYGMGIAMAEPMANPALIGARMYEKFVYPYTKELTDYCVERTGKKVSLHMCGETYDIWNYIGSYQLNEVSLDNIIDLERAAAELGDQVPIAGNVDPVGILLNGTKEQIEEAVKACIEAGKKAKKGYVLVSGCDIPETTAPEQIDYFMEAARTFGCV